MSHPIRILLQSTIERSVDDWAIERFSLLRRTLEDMRDSSDEALCQVDARDRDPPGRPDSVLSVLDRADYDELWLFAVDTGDGLDAEDCAGITRFNEFGGGVLVTRDHMDLGSSVCTLGGVGRAHHFHSTNQERDPDRRAIDDVETASILWPNYHSGSNGNFQRVHPVVAAHPLLTGVEYLPSHPHEGAVDAPEDDPRAAVIASGRSLVSGRPFNLIVAFESSEGRGRAVAESTFHHFADYNWDPSLGAPNFVSEPPGDELSKSEVAQASIRRYVRNLALWLADREIEAA